MKKVLRSFAVGLLVGGLVGLWFGMNIGKDRPLLSNPFADVTFDRQASRGGYEIYRSAERAFAEVSEIARTASRQRRNAAGSAFG